MNTESLYVMYGLLVFGLCGGAYFLQSYISNRERKIEEKRTDELNYSWIERKTIARMSVYKFRKKAHLINPIRFTNGVTVSFVEKRDYVNCITELVEHIKFGIEYEVKGELYYDIIYHNGMISDIYLDDKYSLEDLEGYDWIIETAYNLTEDRIKKIEEEKIKEELFVKSVKNNDVVAKINQ